MKKLLIKVLSISFNYSFYYKTIIILFFLRFIKVTEYLAAQKEIIQIEAATNKAAKLVQLGEKLANSERFHLFSRLYDSYEYQQFAVLLVSIVRNREPDDSLILEEFLNGKKHHKKQTYQTSSNRGC